MRMARQGESLVVEAPAKLNLFLEVHGRRPDGYHELETVMAAVGLCDTLRFRAAPRGEIRFRQVVVQRAPGGPSPPPPTDDRNLVVRAAWRLWDTIGEQPGVEIELSKRIPWQAGLGGGSSDAAATLLALNKLWGLRLVPGELHAVAASLGSDLNFFVAQTPLAVCRGRGELVERLPLHRRLDVVIAQPVGGLSTADVFRRWTPAAHSSALDPLCNWLAGREDSPAAATLYNALQSPAESLHAGVADLCLRLRGYGAYQAAMTGSGSACFGICRSRREALRIAARLQQVTSCRAWAASTAA